MKLFVYYFTKQKCLFAELTIINQFISYLFGDIICLAEHFHVLFNIRHDKRNGSEIFSVDEVFLD